MIKCYLKLFLIVPLFLTGCHRSTAEIRKEKEEATRNFILPLQPKEGKALVYVIYNKIGLSLPRTMAILCTPIDKERHERLNSFWKNLFVEADKSSTANLIAHLKPGEYYGFYLDPGYYEFQHKVAIPTTQRPIPVVETPLGLFLESNKIYYVVSEWIYFYDLPEGIRFRQLKDALDGKYCLSNNFHQPIQKGFI